MSWFVVSEKETEIKWTLVPQKFNELVQKETLTVEDLQWLHENDLLVLMAIRKSGSFKFSAPANWVGIVGQEGGQA